MSIPCGIWILCNEEQLEHITSIPLGLSFDLLEITKPANVPKAAPPILSFSANKAPISPVTKSVGNT